MTSLRMQGRIHDKRSNRVKANVLYFTRFSWNPSLKNNQVVFMIPNVVLMTWSSWSAWWPKSHERSSWSRFSGQQRQPKAPTWLSSPALHLPYTISNLSWWKIFNFDFYFLCFRLSYISLWSPNNNILREKTMSGFNYFRHIFSHRLTPSMRFLVETSCWR